MSANALANITDHQTARKYWNKLKERLRKEGGESVTACHRLKLPAVNGKSYLTDVAIAETLLRLVQTSADEVSGDRRKRAA